MKRVIGLVVLGMFCSNAVLAGDNGEIQAQSVSQSGRIVYGDGTTVENHKYTLLLRHGTTYCAAIIVTNSHALTAAQCVHSLQNNPSQITLYGGGTNSAGGTPIQVEKVVVHPSYIKPINGVADFDIAVLTVAKNSFKGKPNMARIALQTSDLLVGTYCYMVGWGRTDAVVPEPSDKLQNAKMFIVSKGSCMQEWTPQPFQKLPSNMICAQYKSGMGSCKGDIGGPLLCGGKLAGLTSFDHRCSGKIPSVFTKLVAPNIKSFIESETRV